MAQRQPTAPSVHHAPSTSLVENTHTAANKKAHSLAVRIYKPVVLNARVRNIQTTNPLPRWGTPYQPSTARRLYLYPLHRVALKRRAARTGELASKPDVLLISWQTP